MSEADFPGRVSLAHLPRRAVGRTWGARPISPGLGYDTNSIGVRQSKS
jgi:hypothetical protein